MWAVAVSGGADSVALLLLLWAHFPEKRKQMLVLHYDHAVRADSAEDAKFVHKLAEGLGVAFATARRSMGGPVSESALRKVRMKFFQEQLAARQARIIFMGHHRDDVAETMLMRLARGSGASGLCAPRPVRELPEGMVPLRPLLDLTHAELVAGLQKAGAVWREDASNAGDQYLRNRLRHHVLPAWRRAEVIPDLAAGVARARTALEEDAEALESLAAVVMGDLPTGEPLTLVRLASQPRAVVRRALYGWLNLYDARESLNAQAFDTLLDAVMAAQPGRWSAGPGRWIELDNSAVRMTGAEAPAATPWGPLPLKAGRSVALPDGSRLQMRRVVVEQKLLKELRNGTVNPATRAYIGLPKKSATPAMRARSWQVGDRYRPLGAPGRRKLQDLFTDKKIPVRERLRLPVVCSGDNEPWWVPGLPPAHDHRVTAATWAALELTYSPVREIITRLPPIHER